MAKGEEKGKKAADDKKDEQAAPPPKKSKLVLIIILVNVVLILGVGAYFLFFANKPHKTEGEEGKEGEEKSAESAVEEGAGAEGKAKSAEMGPLVQLEPFTVNLDEPGTARYLRVVIQIEVDSKNGEEELKAITVPVRDIIITHLSSLNRSQVQGEVNKNMLRHALRGKINERMKKGKVKEIYFSDFVVQ